MNKVLVDKFAKRHIAFNIAAAALKGNARLEGFKVNLENGFSCSIDLIEQVWNSSGMEFSLDVGHQLHSKADDYNGDISSKGSGESKLLVKGLKFGQGSNVVELGELEFDSLSEAVEFAVKFAELEEGNYEVYKDK